MATKQQYRSMQGKVVDLGQLIAKNELIPAVGNANVNARGDELGPGGKIVRTREQIMAEYYKNTTESLPDSMPNRAKTKPVINDVKKVINEPIQVDDVSAQEFNFDDPEPIEPQPTDLSKRKRTT